MNSVNLAHCDPLMMHHADSHSQSERTKLSELPKSQPSAPADSHQKKPNQAAEPRRMPLSQITVSNPARCKPLSLPMTIYYQVKQKLHVTSRQLQGKESQTKPSNLKNLTPTSRNSAPTSTHHKQNAFTRVTTAPVKLPSKNTNLQVTTAQPPHLSTAQRAQERARFDEQVRLKAEELANAQEIERIANEALFEERVKLERKRIDLVTKSRTHPVPEFYKEIRQTLGPKKKCISGSNHA